MTTFFIGIQPKQKQEDSETKTIPERYKILKQSYNKAIEAKQEYFYFEGRKHPVWRGKDLIEYMEALKACGLKVD